MAGKYDHLSTTQLIELLEQRDRTKKLGLVWERNDIEADAAVDANFVACRIVQELSDKPAPWDNLVIEGDNFDALRWLRMTHAGRVKCIYIDPPYNTGNKDWVYNDRYMSPDDRFRQSTWLEFLYRRLTLARDLLAEDGVLLVSINDEQRSKIELLLDDVLPGMRIGSFVWRTKDSSNDADRNFSAVHEHVLAYAKSGFSFLGYALDDKKYRHDDNDGRGRYTLDPITKAHDYVERENTYYPIQDPMTGWWYPCNPDSVWRFATRSRLKEGQRLRTATIEDLIEDRRIHFSATDFVVYNTMDELLGAIDEKKGPVDGNGRQLLRRGLPDLEFWTEKPIGLGRPSRRAYWNERTVKLKPVSSYIIGINDQSDGRLHELTAEKQGKATGAITDIFGYRAFQNPKPVSLLCSLLTAAASSDAVILDFFAGSSTTAHAVLKLNSEDGGSRRFIMVSSTEVTTDEPDKNLCRDVTAERIRRLNASENPKHADLAAGFAYLRTHGIAFEDLDYDLTPADAWTALEAMHDLPLTPYDTARSWNLHEGEAVALVLVDRFDPALIDWLKGRDRQNLFVYAWAPGQIAQHLDGTHADIRPVRETLMTRFQQ